MAIDATGKDWRVVTKIIEDTVTCTCRVPTIRPDWRLSGPAPPPRPGEHFVRPGVSWAEAKIPRPSLRYAPPHPKQEVGSEV